jgi:type I restriction enzyme S subunit
MIYNYWFVQFDFPDENGRPYKAYHGKMIFNKELNREVPVKWEISKMKSKIKIGSGFPFDSSTYLKMGKYKIITIKNVQELRIETTKVDFIDKIPENISDFCKLNVGDILMSLTGNVGRICLVPENNLLLNQRVGKILCDSIYRNFAYLFFQREEERLRLEQISTGSSQKNLSPVDAVDNYTFFPPEKMILNI